jgi:hypothetical protein
MLAGGRYWSEVWVWQQGTVTADTAVILPEPEYPGYEEESVLAEALAVVDGAIAGHARRAMEINQTPVAEYLKIPVALLPSESPAGNIIDALLAAGWTAPAEKSSTVSA